MAQVQKVELEIKRQSPTSKGTAELIVRSTLSFATEEIGKEFRLKIALYGSEEGETSIPKENGSMQPIYVFQFSNPPMILPKRDYTIIHALSDTILHEETRLIPVAFLDDHTEHNQHYLMLPIPDKLYALVNLSIESYSNTVQLLYVPVGKAVPVKEKPQIHMHVL